MPNYQNGKIYKIVCDVTNLIYYGSTVQKYLSNRITGHRENNKKGMTSGIDGMTNPKIYLVEKFPCECKEELLKRERFFIENNDCINKKIPLRTPKEYHRKNKDKINAKSKEYYEKNKDELKTKQKEYREKNKDKIKAKNKEYKANNKERINARARERYALKKLKST